MGVWDSNFDFNQIWLLPVVVTQTHTSMSLLKDKKIKNKCMEPAPKRCIVHRKLKSGFRTL